MKILSKLLLSFVISFTAFGSFNLSAQEVEEVVVTATRREESIQDVALSIQAFRRSPALQPRRRWPAGRVRRRMPRPQRRASAQPGHERRRRRRRHASV